MKLDLSSLQQAVKSLQEVLREHDAHPHNVYVRDAAVKRFEYTYEMAFKTLRRFLEMSAFSPSEFTADSFQDIVRSGNERGLLLGDISSWSAYRKMRNITSHTYDEDKAEEVIASIPKFYEEARFLLERLKEQNA
jgi:nucleotidyltransferase substrate binding protein (TIGR01987 family)